MSTATTAVIGKLHPAVKAEWLAALRSGDYQQGKSYLRQIDDQGTERHCCLGVLCDLAVQHNAAAVRLLPPSPATDRVVYAYGSATQMPGPDVRAWAFSVEPQAGYSWRVPYWPEVSDEEGRTYMELSELNDDRELTFEQIADLIETHL